MLPPPMKSVLIFDPIVSPKIAVPTRTWVAPSAIANSRSADIPIESVSTESPAAAHASKHPLSCRNCARSRSTSCVGSGIPMMPRSRRCGRRATACARPSASAGATPLFVTSPLDVHLNQHVERASGVGTCRAQSFGDAPPVDGFDPVERRRQSEPCCSAAARSGATPDRRDPQGRPASRGLPARNSRRTRVAPARTPPGWLPRKTSSRRPGEAPIPVVGRPPGSAAAMRWRAACHAFSYWLIIESTPHAIIAAGTRIACVTCCAATARIYPFAGL